MKDDTKFLLYVLYILICAGIVGTFDRQAEELSDVTQTQTGESYEF